MDAQLFFYFNSHARIRASALSFPCLGELICMLGNYKMMVGKVTNYGGELIGD